MIFAEAALTPDGWRRAVRVTLTGDRIAAVMPASAPRPEDLRVHALVPGVANLHSHAFQRGFSGLAERRGPGADSFWTWREVMYRFALRLSPDQVRVIAAMAYVEMLEAGFTRVGEFHYLHHAPDGRPYGDPAEMSAQIVAAAEATGIALTHLPVFYAHGGFGGAPAGEGQRRFLNDLDGFARLVQRCEALLRRPQDRLGVAPHSLRAVTGEELATLVSLAPGRPIHIHVAEQLREVEESLAFSGQRPVEWLLARHEVGPDWCLIHATHLDGAEAEALAGSGAVVGLCPITEANLGDGIFPALEHLAVGGRFGVGTDSNVEIGLASELRMLEYGQRLSRRERNLLAAGEGSTGAALVRGAAAGGAQALAAPPPEIAQGRPADLVALADGAGLEPMGDRELDRWIFGRDLRVAEVWASGRHVVRNGRHIGREGVVRDYARVLREVLD